MEITHSTENKIQDKNTDELTTAIGEFGRWQKIFIVTLFIPTKFSLMWTQLAIVFFAPKTTFNCIERTSVNISLNNTCYEDCVRYEYFSEFSNTIISEWDLVCERAWLANFTQTMCMFGLLVGSMMTGFQSDRFGRRPALLTCSVLLAVASWIIPFIKDFWAFTTLRFFQGAALGGIKLIPHIIMMEVTGPRKREMVNTYAMLPISIGHTVLPLLAFYLSSWNDLCLGIAVMNSALLFYFFIVPESPKWLITSGQVEKAVEILKGAAKCNKLPTELLPAVAEGIYKENCSNKGKVKASYIDLLTKSEWRVKNISSCICWFLLGLGYYASNQYIGQSSSNAFASVAMAGAFQFPGVLLSGICCKYIGRRKTMVGYLIVAAISNATLILPNDWFYFKLVAGSLGVSTIAGAFATMYVYTAEIFPTIVRNMAMGSSSTAARVGSMLAPLVAGLATTGFWVPPLVCTVAPIVAAVVFYLLPETRGVKLQDV